MHFLLHILRQGLFIDHRVPDRPFNRTFNYFLAISYSFIGGHLCRIFGKKVDRVREESRLLAQPRTLLSFRMDAKLIFKKITHSELSITKLITRNNQHFSFSFSLSFLSQRFLQKPPVEVTVKQVQKN